MIPIDSIHLLNIFIHWTSNGVINHLLETKVVDSYNDDNSLWSFEAIRQRYNQYPKYQSSLYMDKEEESLELDTNEYKHVLLNDD